MVHFEDATESNLQNVEAEADPAQSGTVLLYESKEMKRLLGDSPIGSQNRKEFYCVLASCASTIVSCSTASHPDSHMV